MGQADFYRYWFDGRAVAGIRAIDDERYAAAFAFVHPNDEMRKETGRSIIDGRLEKARMGSAYVTLRKRDVRVYSGIYNALSVKLHRTFMKHYNEEFYEMRSRYPNQEMSDGEERFEHKHARSYAYRRTASDVGIPVWFVHRMVNHAEILEEGE